jgi:hypothetical protein
MEKLLGTTGLARFTNEQFDCAEENRRQVEAKWATNLACALADPDIDPKGPWKGKERNQKWKSDTFFDFARQKVKAARSVGEDLVLAGDRVPVRVSLPADIAPEEREGGDADRQTLQGAIEAALETCDAVTQFSRMWWQGAIFGESYSHRTLFPARELSLVRGRDGSVALDHVEREVPGVEWVSVWECYRDAERERVDDGRYFFRRRYVGAAELMELGGQDNYSVAAIKRVVAGRPSLSDTADVVSGATHDRLPPALRSLVRRRGDIDLRECWVFAPKKLVARFEKLWARDVAGHLGGSRVLEDVGELTPVEAAEQVRVLLMMADGEPIGFLSDPPARCTYTRAVWDEAADERGAEGICDAALASQHVLNGLVRSIENNTKLLSNLMLAVKDGALASRLEDAFEEGGILRFRTTGEDIRHVVQQLQFADVTGPAHRAFEMFLHLGDLSTAIPRIQQGQSGEGESTAYELQQRIAAAGKYLVSVVRRFNTHAQDAVEWIVSEEVARLGLRMPVTARSDLFSAFQTYVRRMERVLGLFSLLAERPVYAARMKPDWWLRELAELHEIPYAAAFLTEREAAEAEAAAAQSEERQIELARQQAIVETERAKAEKYRAEAAAAEGKLLISQAEAAAAIRDRARVPQ